MGTEDEVAEVITEPIVAYLEEIVAAGAFLEGALDQSLNSFRVAE